MARKGKEHQNKKNKQKINKEGLGPSEVALRATSPDPLNPPKTKTKSKTKKEGLGPSEVALRATSPDP